MNIIEQFMRGSSHQLINLQSALTMLSNVPKDVIANVPTPILKDRYQVIMDSAEENVVAQAVKEEFPTEYDCTALANHVDSIVIAFNKAWENPCQDIYPEGAIVWLLDHYNTATVMGVGAEPLTYLVSTVDADGEIKEYIYPITEMRPAVSEVCFVYPSIS